MYITVPPAKTMTKRLAIIAILSMFLLTASWSLAQEKTSPKPSSKTATASAAIDDKKVQELKEKLATQVAQLRESQKRGFFGEVASAAKTSFTLVTRTGEVRVRFSEDTKFFKLTSKGKVDAKIDDLKNGQMAAVLGLFDSENKQQNAKVIILQGEPLVFLSGVVSDVNKTDAVIKITEASGQSASIDYEKTTVTDEVNTSKKIAKSGLSRIASGDTLIVWAVTSDEDSKKFSARRILRLPQEVVSPNAPKTEVKPSPTSESSPKATPAASTKATVKASPKASPSASPKS